MNDFHPGIWCTAHVLKDTLEIIKLPIVMIHLSKKKIVSYLILR